MVRGETQVALPSLLKDPIDGVKEIGNHCLRCISLDDYPGSNSKSKSNG